jgi:hypothetical protein
VGAALVNEGDRSPPSSAEPVTEFCREFKPSSAAAHDDDAVQAIFGRNIVNDGE